jgi:hypothetical protein
MDRRRSLVVAFRNQEQHRVGLNEATEIRSCKINKICKTLTINYEAHQIGHDGVVQWFRKSGGVGKQR